MRRLLAVALAALLLAGCTGTPTPTPRADPKVVVASFDFSESALLAEVYAQALEAAGVPVRRELRLGPRELVLPALRQGLVDVVPEYLGSAAAAVVPTTGPSDPGGRAAELAAALRPDGLRVLTASTAQDQNGLAVTRQTAQRWRLRTVSDLRGHSRELVLGGPPECPRRPYCLVGFEHSYGLRFKGFLPYATEGQRVTALTEGVVDVAVVFTTDGMLAAGDLVLLADDAHLQPPEQVVPVVSKRVIDRYGSRVARTLDAVSAALDSAGLTFLNWRVEVAGGDVRAEARGWLQRHGLAAR